MQLTHDEHGESIVKIKSIAMIDHYDEMNKRDKHLILDQWPFPPQDTFNRLIRMGQKFKVSMYHTKAQLQELEAKALAQQKQEKQAGKAA